METKNNLPGLVLVCAEETAQSGVYEVPENVYLSAGTSVLVDDCIKGELRGVCITDTVYFGSDEYDFLRKALHVTGGFPTVTARITVQRFPNGG